MQQAWLAFLKRQGQVLEAAADQLTQVESEVFADAHAQTQQAQQADSSFQDLPLPLHAGIRMQVAVTVCLMRLLPAQAAGLGCSNKAFKVSRAFIAGDEAGQDGGPDL